MYRIAITFYVWVCTVCVHARAFLIGVVFYLALTDHNLNWDEKQRWMLTLVRAHTHTPRSSHALSIKLNWMCIIRYKWIFNDELLYTMIVVVVHLVIFLCRLCFFCVIYLSQHVVYAHLLTMVRTINARFLFNSLQVLGTKQQKTVWNRNRSFLCLHANLVYVCESVISLNLFFSQQHLNQTVLSLLRHEFRIQKVY